MALNIKTFKTRALSSVIFVAVMLTCLWMNAWSFAILFTIVHFGCWYEYIKLIEKITRKNYVWLLSLGILYITVPIVMMLDLAAIETPKTASFGEIFGPNFSVVLPSAIIFSIWINDTMAYVVGSFIGKTPFSPISPNKTWEGTIGGAILCVLVISLLGWYSKYFSLWNWICIGAICAIAGTLGDLFESKLKRLAQVKDSGNLMPGHGGFLDRFDSLLFAVPAVWIYWKLVMNGQY